MVGRGSRAPIRGPRQHQPHVRGRRSTRRDPSVGESDLPPRSEPRHPGRLQAPRLGVHDTAKHMRFLGETIASQTGHALHAAAAEVAARIAAGWSAWRGTLDLPERIAHGDPKVSNLRFTGDEVTGILDLDTIGWLPYAAEMGDAWRSWCNPAASEDDLDGTRFDVPTFAASLEGWLSTGPALETAERSAIVPGIERICLELSARFCADALANTYFREDRERWPQVGTHCLARARAQL